MDTDPNPFRDSPDEDRSSSSTEAPSDDTQDVNADAAGDASDEPSPMSEDEEDK